MSREDTNFRKYQHIERFGTTEVEGIELGTCYVFPKLDGTNGSIWCTGSGNIMMGDGYLIQCGSRRRSLDINNDNAGFCKWVNDNYGLWYQFFYKNPDLRLFGEWLVPHSLKTYKEDAWGRFYVFDVAIDAEEGINYMPYEQYKQIIDEWEFIDYVSPISIIKNGSYEKFVEQLQKNVFQIEDGKGAGEGIVIKNYAFYNKYGRQTWAKIVTSEFKEKHSKEMGAPVMNGRRMVEQDIADKYCTEALVEKVFSKISVECDGWSSKLIPRLLNTVYYDIVREDAWSFIKEFKNPVIDFKKLQQLVVAKIKEIKPEVF